MRCNTTKRDINKRESSKKKGRKMDAQKEYVREL